MDLCPPPSTSTASPSPDVRRNDHSVCLMLCRLSTTVLRLMLTGNLLNARTVITQQFMHSRHRYDLTVPIYFIYRFQGGEQGNSRPPSTCLEYWPQTPSNHSKPST